MPVVIKEIAITRMDCPTCVVTLENSVMKVPGVKKAQSNYLKKTIKVAMDDSTPLVDVEKAIEEVGYQIAYKRYPNPLLKLQSLFARDYSNAIPSINDGDFPEKVLQSSNIVAVLFRSENCPSCKVIEPQIKKLAEKQMGQTKFYEMDVVHTETWKQYNVMGIPTLIVFRRGKASERFGAMLRIDELEKTLV